MAHVLSSTVLLAIVLFSAISTRTLPVQILRLAELNTEQIRSLDKERTVVLIPGGILEEHGPFLPSFTDGYRNEATTEELARVIVARPGWTTLIFPTIRGLTTA